MDMKGCAVVVIACKLAQESEESVVKKHDSHDGHDRTNWDRQHPPPGTKHPTRYKKTPPSPSNSGDAKTTTQRTIRSNDGPWEKACLGSF